jgi:hypothetical protein
MGAALISPSSTRTSKRTKKKVKDVHKEFHPQSIRFTSDHVGFDAFRVLVRELPDEDEGGIGHRGRAVFAFGCRPLRVAREGIVLLKNDAKKLPLDKNTTARIAVIGVNAQGEPPTCGGSASVPASSDFTSEIDGIKAQAPGATVDYIAECVPDPATSAWQTGTGTGLVGQYFNSNDLSGSGVRFKPIRTTAAGDCSPPGVRYGSMLAESLEGASPLAPSL